MLRHHQISLNMLRIIIKRPMNSFMTEVLIIKKPVYSKWTDFYIIGASVMKELNGLCRNLIIESP